jgi:hypothetical protein
MHLFASLSPLLFVFSNRDAAAPKHATTQLSSSPLTSIGEKLDGHKYDALLEWVRAQDGSEIHPSIELRPSISGDGYGAFVAAPVAAGELLFSIPRSACVTVEDGTEDSECGPTFRTLIEKAGPGGNTVVIAGFLAMERLRSLEHARQMADEEEPGVQCEDSRFGPYLDTLPWERGVNNQEHALFWEKADLVDLLAGTMAFEEAASLRAEVELATKVLGGIIGKTVRQFRGEAVKSGFQWPWEVTAEPPASGTVKGLPEAVTGAFVSLLTRAFQDGEGDEEKLVPILDLLQHSDDPNISHGMRKEDGGVEVRSRQDLQEGDELLNQYRSELEETMRKSLPQEAPRCDLAQLVSHPHIHTTLTTTQPIIGSLHVTALFPASKNRYRIYCGTNPPSFLPKKQKSR